MSHADDKDVGVVIDDALIRGAIDEEAEATKRDDVDPAKYQKPEMNEVSELALSFKSIYQIDNLVGLEQLVKLRLDNNTVTKIENLEHLVNLKWLDLSFNNISKIEGLDTLTKLTDLSLYNNAITVIEGLDNNKLLQCVSLGNNEIKNTDHIMYLRGFPVLNLVNLDGNPVCEDPDYRTVCLAYLKPLKYLDYEMIEPSEVTRAKEMCQDDLLEVEEKESIEAIAAERDAAREAMMSELRGANIEVVETLFDEMFKEDPEMGKLNVLPGIQELVEEYHESFKNSTEAFKELALAKNKEFVKEVAAVRRGVLFVTTEADKTGVQMVTSYQKRAKKTFRNMREAPEVDLKELEPLKKANTELCEALLALEMETVEQVEELIDTFETHAGDLRNNMLDIHNTFFRGVEEFENDYFEALGNLVEDLMKKLADEVLGDISVELSTVLQDRDSTNNSVGVSHDAHVSKLLGREDEMRDKENGRFSSTMDDLKGSEKTRNRDRVQEITAIRERHVKAMHEEFAEEIADEEEGYA